MDIPPQRTSLLDLPGEILSEIASLHHLVAPQNDDSNSTLFLDILVRAPPRWILERFEVARWRDSIWQEAFERRFLPSWKRYKGSEDSWRTAFLRMLGRLDHRAVGCSHHESWTRFITLRRNGSATINRIYTRTFDPNDIFDELKHQANLAQYPTQVRVLVHLQDLRVIALGVLMDRPSFVVNPNAHLALHPPLLRHLSMRRDWLCEQDLRHEVLDPGPGNMLRDAPQATLPAHIPLEPPPALETPTTIQPPVQTPAEPPVPASPLTRTVSPGSNFLTRTLSGASASGSGGGNILARTLSGASTGGSGSGSGSANRGGGNILTRTLSGASSTSNALSLSLSRTRSGGNSLTRTLSNSNSTQAPGQGSGSGSPVAAVLNWARRRGSAEAIPVSVSVTGEGSRRRASWSLGRPRGNSTAGTLPATVAGSPQARAPHLPLASPVASPVASPPVLPAALPSAPPAPAPSAPFTAASPTIPLMPTLPEERPVLGDGDGDKPRNGASVGRSGPGGSGNERGAGAGAKRYHLPYPPLQKPTPAYSHALYPNFTSTALSNSTSTSSPNAKANVVRDFRQDYAEAEDTEPAWSAGEQWSADGTRMTEWDGASASRRRWVGPMIILAQLFPATRTTPTPPGAPRTAEAEGADPDLGPRGTYASLGWEDIDVLLPWLVLRSSGLEGIVRRNGLGFDSDEEV